MKRKILLPDNCHYFDLGESYDFARTIEQFYREHFNKYLDEVIKKLSNPQFKTVLGNCERFTLDYGNGSIEKYAAITYRPKDWDFGEGIGSLAGHWFARAHEEGHALIYFGLSDIVKDILGEDVDYSDEQAVCDLLGLYAADIRKKGHLISPEKRHYFERARRWTHYREQAEEAHRQAVAKKSETTVMSVDEIVEARKRLDRMVIK